MLLLKKACKRRDQCARCRADRALVKERAIPSKWVETLGCVVGMGGEIVVDAVGPGIHELAQPIGALGVIGASGFRSMNRRWRESCQMADSPSASLWANAVVNWLSDAVEVVLALRVVHGEDGRRHRSCRARGPMPQSSRTMLTRAASDFQRARSRRFETAAGPGATSRKTARAAKRRKGASARGGRRACIVQQSKHCMRAVGRNVCGKKNREASPASQRVASQREPRQPSARYGHTAPLRGQLNRLPG